jgi:hypothetical protein
MVHSFTAEIKMIRDIEARGWCVCPEISSVSWLSFDGQQRIHSAIPHPASVPGDQGLPSPKPYVEPEVERRSGVCRLGDVAKLEISGPVSSNPGETLLDRR